jgi:hypothetical protein
MFAAAWARGMRALERDSLMTPFVLRLAAAADECFGHDLKASLRDELLAFDAAAIAWAAVIHRVRFSLIVLRIRWRWVFAGFDARLDGHH